MVDTTSKKKTITESDIATLLQRYDAETILRLLQEMSFYSNIKMDWNELVKKTTTGITNAREYQLLWRHLSYRDPLLPVEDDDAQPLDDDSDMECELEASPEVSVEASMEARAHVRVMAASYVPSESNILDDSTSEAPLMINIPYTLPEGIQEPSESPLSSSGMDIIFPVRLQKVSSTEKMNANGSASNNKASQRKRQRWFAKEDEELLAAVKRYGEGNWTRIFKAEFRGKKTTSQLAQRWHYLRRRCGISTSASPSGPQQTDALSLALGVSPVTSSCTVTETQDSESRSSQGQQQFKPVVLALLARAATLFPASKSRVGLRRTTARLDLMVTANSAAAAACMSGVSPFASVPKVKPSLVSKTELINKASKACLPRPSTSIKPHLMTPRSEVSRMLSASTTPLASASKIFSNKRVLTASVPVTVLPLNPTAETVSYNGGQKEQPRGDGAISLVALKPNQMTSTNSKISSRGKQAPQAQSPNLSPWRIPLAQTVDRTAVPSISGAVSQSKAKCEVNNKVGSVIRVSNVCGKLPEVATVGGTVQGV